MRSLLWKDLRMNTPALLVGGVLVCALFGITAMNLFMEFWPARPAGAGEICAHGAQRAQTCTGEHVMTTKTRGLRLPDDLEREIEREGKERGQSWTRAALDLLSEGVRTRRAPGILFADGPTGRRAVVAGTGLDGWEVIRTWQDGGMSVEERRANYPWLSEAQIRAAIGYHELYPVEVDERLKREREWTADRVNKELPFATPRREGR